MRLQMGIRFASRSVLAKLSIRGAKVISRLQEVYKSEIKSSLQEQFGYSNPMQIPRLQKVVLNMGVGEAVNDSKKVDNALRDMTSIAGQKPVIVRARKSVATFKLRGRDAYWSKGDIAPRSNV